MGTSERVDASAMVVAFGADRRTTMTKIRCRSILVRVRQWLNLRMAGSSREFLNSGGCNHPLDRCRSHSQGRCLRVLNDCIASTAALYRVIRRLTPCCRVYLAEGEASPIRAGSATWRPKLPNVPYQRFEPYEYSPEHSSSNRCQYGTAQARPGHTPLMLVSSDESPAPPRPAGSAPSLAESHPDYRQTHHIHYSPESYRYDLRVSAAGCPSSHQYT